MNCHLPDRLLFFALTLAISSGSSSAFADQQVSLTWDPSPDPTTVGYYIYYGTAGGPMSKVPAGQALRGDLAGLGDDKEYQLYVTAVNSAGEESAPSDVIRYTTPPAPGQVPNTPPLLDPIPDQTVNPGQVLMYQLSAIDFNESLNNLTYSLVDGPAGAQVDAQTGVFSWRIPKNVPATETEVTVQVSDGGSPVLTDTKQFGLRVIPKLRTSSDPDGGTSTTPEVSSGDLPPGTTSLIQTVTWVSQPTPSQPVRFALAVRTDAGPQFLEVSEDLTNWTRLGLVTGPDEIVDATSAINTTRFYRVVPGSEHAANL